ncbi:MAG: hypothetical protein RLY86_3032 [Pseudomonadota bacterium]|jgi:hypothetical protein
MRKTTTGGMLAGKKTYVTGTLTILGALGAWATGDLPLPDLIQTAVPALMLMTVRHGVTTEARR